MIKAEEDTKMMISFKYSWAEEDAEFSGKVDIGWDRTGTCDHRVLQSNRDRCNAAVAKLVETPNNDSISQVVDHLYNKGKRGKCTAKRNLKFRIDNAYKDKFFLIEVDNVSHRAVKNLCYLIDQHVLLCVEHTGLFTDRTNVAFLQTINLCRYVVVSSLAFLPGGDLEFNLTTFHLFRPPLQNY